MRRSTGAPTPDQQISASPAADAFAACPLPRAVYQDDKEEKLKGVKSLIQYATMCEYMLVPTEEEIWQGGLTLGLPSRPHQISGYGTRGWW